MDWLERFQQKFGQWYAGHFGVAEDSELTPKDVLRSIIDAMEDSRSEGLDGRIYVANRYILELAVIYPEERAYLLSFLDEEELATVLERYMAHKNYFTRGPLDFTIQELEGDEDGDKLVVHALFEKGGAGQENPPKAAPPPGQTVYEVDPLTVAAPREESDDPETVLAPPTAWAALLVASADGRRSVFSLAKPVILVGRSRHAGNDLVLPADGQVSKRHLRIELEPDGGATLYDLASTNGTFVNGKMVPVNTILRHGDIIELGQSRMEFQRESEVNRKAEPQSAPPPVEALPETVPPKTPVLIQTLTAEQHHLGSEALIGRSMTCDIVLDEPTASTQQARITRDADDGYVIVDLSGRGTTIVNGRPVRTGERTPLNSGDRLSLGGVAFAFQA